MEKFPIYRKTKKYFLLLIFIIFNNGYSNPFIQSVGIKVGYIDPENVTSTFAIGTSIQSYYLLRNLHLEFELIHWRKSENVEKTINRYSNYYINSYIKLYLSTVSNRFVPFIGGGAGLSMECVKASLNKAFGSVNSYEDKVQWNTLLGLHVYLGELISISQKLKFSIETRYSTSGIDFWGVFTSCIYHF